MNKSRQCSDRLQAGGQHGVVAALTSIQSLLARQYAYIAQAEKLISVLNPIEINMWDLVNPWLSVPCSFIYISEQEIVQVSAAAE